ncbi:DNA-binding MarR family transcriptional regulator [Rhizobium etli]|uniref:DNA-binding MarR family transcriptional regulator n=1 Tax=Rhizobium etli TaxID=29449 RepID=A0A7W6ZJX0_RHIET|nr:DNA-binding MarR family transcriptional regulator [Rhizobium etli]MBB4537418.1 DNA-binding MarR family transcriptional regulator [Rhizobium etli]
MDNLNFRISPMHKNRFRLFIARYKFARFWRCPHAGSAEARRFHLLRHPHGKPRAEPRLQAASRLTYPQYLALAALWEQDGQTVGGLGEKLLLESSTLTPLLKRLESAGYISRERSSADERVVVIRLSEAGIRLKEKAIGIPGCIAEASGRDAGDLTRLQAEIVALREALTKSIA